MGMLPYYFMCIIIIICAYNYNINLTDRKKKCLLFFSLLPVFCLLAFKSEEVGTDTASYMYMYDNAGMTNSIDTDSRIEYGYQYMSVILNRLFESDQTLFIVSSFIVCLSLFVFLRRTSTNPVLALYFFVTMGFFQFSLTGIRQSLAMAITLFAFPLIQKKRFFIYILVILLAMLFHKSAIFCLPLYWMMNMSSNPRNNTLMFLGIIVIYYFAEPFLLTVSEVLNYDYGVESTGNGLEFMCVVLLITLLSYKQKDSMTKNKESNAQLIKANYLSLMMWVIRLISRTAERVSFYFMPYTYVSLEEYLVSRPKSYRVPYIIIASLFATYLFFLRISPNEHLNNYTFFWQ